MRRDPNLTRHGATRGHPGEPPGQGARSTRPSKRSWGWVRFCAANRGDDGNTSRANSKLVEVKQIHF